MALNYYLAPNRITSDRDEYLAVSVDREGYKIEQVYERMTRQGSTLTKAEALAAFEEVMQCIIDIVKEGNSVVTPLVNILPSLSGVFEDEDDRFDPGRHQVRMNVTAGLRLQAAATEVSPEKVPCRERRPAPAHFIDNATGQQDQVITPVSTRPTTCWK
ncbi:MAG: DNA-binding domain-containing protein [Balneolaceae bacterium]|nr:DNA-binding domain-containing protein [Balneolaceae bacterium]